MNYEDREAHYDVYDDDDNAWFLEMIADEPFLLVTEDSPKVESGAEDV